MFKIIVYYEDTDSAGIVYYANYLKYFERARSNFLLNRGGFTNTYIKDNFDLIFLVKSCNIEYLRPAKLDDNITIITTVEKKSKVQIHLIQQAFREKELLVNSKVRLVATNTQGLVIRMPSILYEIFD